MVDFQLPMAIGKRGKLFLDIIRYKVAMGNTVAAPTPTSGRIRSGKARAVRGISEAESDRLFREKIGYISVIQKTQSNGNLRLNNTHHQQRGHILDTPQSNNSAASRSNDLFSGDLVSAVTSITELTNPPSQLGSRTDEKPPLSSQDTGGGSAAGGRDSPNIREIAIGRTGTTASPTNSNDSSGGDRNSLSTKESDKKPPGGPTAFFPGSPGSNNNYNEVGGGSKASSGGSRASSGGSRASGGRGAATNTGSADRGAAATKEYARKSSSISSASRDASSKASVGEGSKASEGSALWALQTGASGQRSVRSRTSQRSRISTASLAAASVRQRMQAATEKTPARADSVTSASSGPSRNTASTNSSSKRKFTEEQDDAEAQILLRAMHLKMEQQDDAEAQILLRAMHLKMEQADLERDSCVNRIETLNHEMEIYRQDTTQQLQQKDETIELHETDIACLKQQIIDLKAKNKDEKTAAMSETRGLLRKVATLQSTLSVIQKERDSAVAAMETGPSEHGSTSTHDPVELKETIQDLLQQLEVSEQEHQREQALLQEEVLLLRKKLERLESEFIVVERTRDDATHRLEQTSQKLEIERALNESDVKKYKDELQKWKDRYVQELRFSNREASEMLQQSTVILGSRLSAGILEGIEEVDEEDDENLEPMSSSVPTSIASSNGDNKQDTTYHRLLARLQTVASPVPLMDVTTSAVPSSVTGSNGSGTAWIPSGDKGHHQPMSEVSFDENISIPSFLSKIW